MADIKPKVWINSASSTIYRNKLERANTEDEGILGRGRWVIPKKLNDNGYKFQYETVESAIKKFV